MAKGDYQKECLFRLMAYYQIDASYDGKHPLIVTALDYFLKYIEADDVDNFCEIIKDITKFFPDKIVLREAYRILVSDKESKLKPWKTIGYDDQKQITLAEAIDIFSNNNDVPVETPEKFKNVSFEEMRDDEHGNNLSSKQMTDKYGAIKCGAYWLWEGDPEGGERFLSKNDGISKTAHDKGGQEVLKPRINEMVQLGEALSLGLKEIKNTL